MIIVDSWKAYSGSTFGNGTPTESQKEFYSHLAAELIDNTYDKAGSTGAQSPGGEAPAPAI
jgi:hypothetical protein